VASQVDGSISVSYSVESSTNHTVTDPSHKVNDNDYHVVSFVRAGTDGLLRVDRELIQSLQTPGRHRRLILVPSCVTMTTNLFDYINNNNDSNNKCPASMLLLLTG